MNSQVDGDLIMKAFFGDFIHCPLICNTFLELLQKLNNWLPGHKNKQITGILKERLQTFLNRKTEH